MAEVHKLKKFDDLSIIGDYAERFARNPDQVFWDTSFDTVMHFLWKWKEQNEYQERYQFIYNELTKPNDNP